ncbi:MAG: PASTA domain-containing protein [Clostridium sp.]|nr:PASTA domain-containing protein [Prevotella sp.]MCM1428806.1 PASTA domain-containing protein [Clostridium sp.]MCM1475181.1 PASTA domain-containing protein [Muribaculaceae bacterium]
MNNDYDKITASRGNKGEGFIGRHPIIANSIIIILVALLGIWIVYISIALFTKHGQSDIVPRVENMSYTKAIEILHEQGLNVEIRDSLYKDNVKPGYVIEQFPKPNSVVKPGRKVFLYINAVHPKEVVIDDNHNTNEYALRGKSFRQGMARLEELGFKDIKVVKVLGTDDRIVKITANGVVVRNMQKIPINSRIIIEVSDGRLNDLRDSLFRIEQQRYFDDQNMREVASPDYGDSNPGYSPAPVSEPETPARQQEATEEESLEFF